jgi:hypothetical protein
VSWTTVIEDRVHELLAALERIADALERIAALLNERPL